MAVAVACKAFKSTPVISWRSTGKLQKTVASCIERSGKTLHSGKETTVKIWPELAGKGRYFDYQSKFIPASVEFAQETPLCTTLCKDGHTIRTVEHLLYALEATGVDNCRIEINDSDSDDRSVEVPILDGSASDWVRAIEQAGLKVATNHGGNNYLKMVPAIGFQWFSSASFDDSFHAMQIAPSRTFCIYEEVEKMREVGLIKGGSLENAIVCSSSRGWLNPPLRFSDEPCRHKVLDLIGDLSLFAQCGNQGLPVAHIVDYKAGHALHVDFVRRLYGIN